MTTTPNTVSDTPCRHTISLQDFTHIAVGPALFLILILSLFEKRRKARRCRCCGDRPGLLVPVNLLDGDEDRLAYAAAFGSTATNCLNLFGGGYLSENSPMWTQVLLAMVAVTEMGIDFYPFFACLGKKNSLIWSLIGLAYSVIWLLVNLGHVFECVDASEWVFTGEPVVINLPVLVCLFYLVITFLYRTISTSVKTLRSLLHSHTLNMEETHLVTDSKIRYELAKSQQVDHITELLKGRRSNLPLLENQSTGLWGLIYYQRDPTFRYSPRITATFTVAFLCLYEFGLLLFLTIEKGLVVAKDSMQNTNLSSNVAMVFGMGLYKQLNLLLLVIQMSWYTAFGVASVVMINYILRIFLSYKVQMKRLMRGDHSMVPKHCIVLPRSKIMCYDLASDIQKQLLDSCISSQAYEGYSPKIALETVPIMTCFQMDLYITTGVSSMVKKSVMWQFELILMVSFKQIATRFCGVIWACSGVTFNIHAHSLMYSGAQIAYILWGYYVMITAIFFCCLLVAYLFILPLLGLVSKVFLEPFWTILPTVFMSFAVYYLQIYISKKVLVLKEHYCSNDTLKSRRVLALDNRRVYHNVSYFLFFYHILLGLYTCLVRVGKGILLGVIFLGRIDRSGLIKGFEHWDTGYLSYVSFLQVEIAHTHPVLVVFCQLLLNAHRERKLAQLTDSNHSTNTAPYKRFNGLEMTSLDRLARIQTRWLKAYTLIKNPSLRSSFASEPGDWKLQHLHVQ